MNAVARNCWMNFVCAMRLCALAYAGSVPVTINDNASPSTHGSGA